MEYPKEATEAWWGIAKTDRKTYRPLDDIEIWLGTPLKGAHCYRAEIFDGRGRKYGSAAGEMCNGEALVRFIAGGASGMQHIEIWFDSQNEGDLHDRLINIYLEADSRIECSDPDISSMYRLTKESVRLNRRRYTLPEGAVTGYTTADSGNTLDFWMRDMFYSMGAYMLFENDIRSGFEALWERQHTDGYFPDWVDETGRSGRMTSESDVEYIAVLALERVWLITGDDDWMKRKLPIVEKGLGYLTSDPLRWDKEKGMVKRGHTCDTWDFDIYTDMYAPGSPSVAAVCDQSGLYAAFISLSRMHMHLGDLSRAGEYSKKAENFRERCNEQLWDGKKYQHHLHLDKFDHDNFDESKQLAMGNTWAMTRGLADRGRCAAIMETYRQRWTETGSRFPWWSLEPGYPVEMGKVLSDNSSYLCPGGYSNGGMMPWVGAALSLAAFRNGYEEFGAELLRDYAKFLRDNEGSIYTWYWPDMQPGFRTTTRNTTGHDGWGMGYWMDTLIEGLAGLKIMESGFRRVELTPRWISAGIKKADVVLSFPSTDDYIAYSYRYNETDIDMLITGTTGRADLRIMMPADRMAGTVLVNGAKELFCMDMAGYAIYLKLSLKGGPVWNIRILFEGEKKGI